MVFEISDKDGLFTVITLHWVVRDVIHLLTDAISLFEASPEHLSNILVLNMPITVLYSVKYHRVRVVSKLVTNIMHYKIEYDTTFTISERKSNTISYLYHKP